MLNSQSKLPHNSARIAKRNTIWRYRTRNDTPRPDHAVLSDSYSWEDNTSSADPNVILNLHWQSECSEKGNLPMCCIKIEPFLRKNRVGSGINLYIRSDKHIIADSDFLIVYKL